MHVTEELYKDTATGDPKPQEIWNTIDKPIDVEL